MSAASTGEHQFGGPANGRPLLEVDDLKRYFQLRGKGGLFGKKVLLKAVDGITFTVAKGETLGIVGESGCGKTTAARLVLNMVAPTSGSVVFNGREISGLSPSDWRALRREMQYVFQDPLGALDPRMKIVDQVIEPLVIHKIGTPSERQDKVAALLHSVGLKDYTFGRYPHELSGGQRPRAGLALDVSIPAQVINLLDELRGRLNLTMLFISHDLSIVRHICDRVAVMYLGKIVELADGDALFDSPAHPYTRALLSAIPVPEPGLKRERIFLTGDPPSPIDPPSGCRFRTRCPLAVPVCAERTPELKALKDGQLVACHVAHGEA